MFDFQIMVITSQSFSIVFVYQSLLLKTIKNSDFKIGNKLSLS